MKNNGVLLKSFVDLSINPKILDPVLLQCAYHTLKWSQRFIDSGGSKGRGRSNFLYLEMAIIPKRIVLNRYQKTNLYFFFFNQHNKDCKSTPHIFNFMFWIKIAPFLQIIPLFNRNVFNVLSHTFFLDSNFYCFIC